MRLSRNTILKVAMSGVIITLWSSCKKDEQVVAPPVPGNEFLTTVKLVATNIADPNDVQTASWIDLDPDDSTPPDISHAILNLHANAKYNVEVKFLDETKSPAEDITSEIKERANYHLICFIPQGGLNLDIQRTDLDTNVPALPVGLDDSFTTGAVSAGNLNVRLRHQPNVKDGTCDPGSTDANVDFQINIQ